MPYCVELGDVTHEELESVHEMEVTVVGNVRSERLFVLAAMRVFHCLFPC